MEPKTIGTQGVIDLCAWRMITCSTQKTLNSYDKFNWLRCTAKKNRYCFTLGTVISSFHCFYQGLVVTVDQWLCLVKLHGTVPSQTSKIMECVIVA